MELTKRSVKTALGFRLDKELAEFFGVSKAAISAYGDDEPLPAGRQWQAIALRPDLFGPQSEDSTMQSARPN